MFKAFWKNVVTINLHTNIHSPLKHRPGIFLNPNLTLIIDLEPDIDKLHKSHKEVSQFC